uniref:Putative ecdysteroid kinase n=1 Tax=Triatoma infestans TaxID=30076 RepID=A0A023F6B5_TRIIF
MYDINEKDCLQVLSSYFNSDHFELIEFHGNGSSEASLGLLGNNSSVWCKVRINKKIKEVNFFVKTLPLNDFHRECVNISGCFLKETIFYNQIRSGMKKYLCNKVIPEFYYSNSEKIILEDLCVAGYKNSNLNGYFDLQHCLSSLKSLAEFHASSLLYERDLGLNLDKNFPDITFYSWISDIEDHPGQKHILTGISAIKRILDQYFTHHPICTRQKVIEILLKVPVQLKPSKSYRNCLSHVDLWCNNIMFKYNEEFKVEDAVLIDFQLFGYNPPSLDFLMLIYLNTAKTTREKHFTHFISHYYTHFCNVLQNFNIDPVSVLKKKDLVSSMSETLETTLSLTILYLHYVLIPVEDLLPIVKDVEKFKYFLWIDRSDLILSTITKDEVYKEKLFNAINDLINHVIKLDSSAEFPHDVNII